MKSSLHRVRQGPTPIPAPKRFFKFLLIDECWTWQGSGTGTGYGMFWDGKRRVLAHRWSYEYFVGEIPEGLTIDHLCRQRSCVRPSHLEPVTLKENIGRAWRGPYNIKTYLDYLSPDEIERMHLSRSLHEAEKR